MKDTIKTSLQILMQDITESKEINISAKVVLIAHAFSLLEKEKKDLIRAFNEGLYNGDNYGMDAAEQYFNQTFEI